MSFSEMVSRDSANCLDRGDTIEIESMLSKRFPTILSGRP